MDNSICTIRPTNARMRVFITCYSIQTCFSRGAIIIIRSFPHVPGSTGLMHVVKHFMFFTLNILYIPVYYALTRAFMYDKATIYIYLPNNFWINLSTIIKLRMRAKFRREDYSNWNDAQVKFSLRLLWRNIGKWMYGSLLSLGVRRR
jgi:hypothetical protein